MEPGLGTIFSSLSLPSTITNAFTKHTNNLQSYRGGKKELYNKERGRGGSRSRAGSESLRCHEGVKTLPLELMRSWCCLDKYKMCRHLVDMPSPSRFLSLDASDALPKAEN